MSISWHFRWTGNGSARKQEFNFFCFLGRDHSLLKATFGLWIHLFKLSVTCCAVFFASLSCMISKLNRVMNCIWNSCVYTYHNIANAKKQRLIIKHNNVFTFIWSWILMRMKAKPDCFDSYRKRMMHELIYCLMYAKVWGFW